MRRLQASLQQVVTQSKHGGLPMDTCSQQGCLQHWLCYGLGTAWGALGRGKGPHLRRIHHDRPGDFPNTVHRKKEQLFPLNKRGPPFTSAQALRPEGMGRHGGICSWKGWELHYPTHWFNCSCIKLVYLHLFVQVKTTVLTCLVREQRPLVPLLTHSLRLTTHWPLPRLPVTLRTSLVGMLSLLCWISEAFGEGPTHELVQCDEQRWEAVLSELPVALKSRYLFSSVS